MRGSERRKKLSRWPDLALPCPLGARDYALFERQRPE